MFVYLVSSYRDPEQLYRLLARLRAGSPAARLIVSHDRKSPPLDPGRLAAVDAEHRLTPEPVQWGDATYLKSILAVLGTLELAPDDWVTLLTAQDYPLRPLSRYEQHLGSCGADMLLEQSILSNPDRDVLLRRYRSRTVTVPARLDRKLVRGAVNALPGLSWHRMPHGVPPKVDLPRRWPFDDLVLRMGSDLYALSGRAVAALLRTTRTRPEVLRYFERTRIPSEAYVHTVLLNEASLVNRPEDVHHKRWRGLPHPDLLGRDDLDELRASEHWFARKFPAGDPVLDRLDEALTTPGSPVPTAQTGTA